MDQFELSDSVLFMFSTATHLQLTWGIVKMFVFGAFLPHFRSIWLKKVLYEEPNRTMAQLVKTWPPPTSHHRYVRQVSGIKPLQRSIYNMCNSTYSHYLCPPLSFFLKWCSQFQVDELQHLCVLRDNARNPDMPWALQVLTSAALKVFQISCPLSYTHTDTWTVNLITSQIIFLLPSMFVSHTAGEQTDCSQW